MPWAQVASRRTGIDPRIIVAQAALESAWGQKAPGNNLFGIKSHGRSGGQTLRTTEVVDGKPVSVNASFRQYGSPQESVQGYADFMIENPRYRPMREAQGLDAQLQALGASGYATDPKYAQKVSSIAGMISGGGGSDTLMGGGSSDYFRQRMAEQSAAPAQEQEKAQGSSYFRDRFRREAGPQASTENSPAEGMTPNEATEAYQNMPAIKRIALSAAAGIPFVGEWLDEARGLLRGEAEGEALRQFHEYQAEANPGEDAAARIGGAVVGAIPMVVAGAAAAPFAAPASLVGQVAAGLGIGAATGAVEGAVSGAGRNAEDRLGGAGQGALVGGIAGGVMGAVAPALGAGVRNAVGYFRGRPDAAAARAMGASPESVGVVGRMLQNDDPAQAAARINAAGPGGMVADAGPASAGLLDTAIQKAGPGGRIAREAIDDRAVQASRQVAAGLDDAFGPPVAASRPAPLKGAYDRAYAAPIDYSSAAGREIETLLPRIPGGIVQRANNLMRVEGVTSRQILADIADDGTVAFREMPDVRQLDYITRALNDVGKRGDGMGALGGNTNEGRVYMGLARDIRAALKDAVPAYETALNRAATEIGQKEAREMGEVAMRAGTTRGDLAENLADMTAVEVQKLKEGVRTYLDDTLANVRRTMTDGNVEAREGLKALSELSSRASRQKLEMILGPGQARALTGKLDRAAKAFELRAATATNSRTFGRQSMDEALKSLTEPGAIGKLMEGSPVNAARKLVQTMTRMTPAARAEVEQRIAGEIATLLTQSRGPQAAARATEIVRLLERQPATQQLARNVGRLVTAGTAGAGYQSGQQLIGTRR